ncbi:MULTISPECIES: TadE family type IV pilus minor pilin [unclassified Kitasatospora]|uniref:TadE family type IV pilus minor pilin n=1 Tax=unclassified Kitasatospora TaxID=2633591 RepID=UPI002476BC57|nr:TadE family type IV pilus minor pilin [Kitasatospora sp. MAP12-44]
MTAETAVVLPTLVLLMALLVWGVLTTAAQLRCIDAARVGARSAARGDGDALALARAAAPRGATVRLVQDKETVRVEVEAECLGPGGLAAALSLRLTAQAVAVREDVSGEGLA